MSLTDDIIDAASDRIPTWPGRWYSQETRREEMREVLEIAYRAGQIAQAEEDALKVRTERDAALAENARLRAAMFDILENVDEPPDSNCSCHISPPCNDCVDYAGLRRALKEGYAALAKETP